MDAARRLPVAGTTLAASRDAAARGPRQRTPVLVRARGMTDVLPRCMPPGEPVLDPLPGSTATDLAAGRSAYAVRRCCRRRTRTAVTNAWGGRRGCVTRSVVWPPGSRGL